MPRLPTAAPPNRLSDETSPYLREHAHGPVDWVPWGPDALARAQAEDRPILLSVGFSACHGCHAMRRESFEDLDTAAAMNAHFINVKVDREERPDLDELYMKAVEAFTGGPGGWPITAFLTPDGRPFYAGTYLPPQPTPPLPSFRQVLDHVVDAWTNRREELDRVATDLTRQLADRSRLPAPTGEPLRVDWCAQISAAASGVYDPANGGFGSAPKFPSPSVLAAMLVDWHQRRDPLVREQLLGTLDGMARGGLYDLLDGGFARSSVDAAWRIPRFEKMLCDNAQLVPIYASSARAFDRPDYARIARETCAFVDRVLTNEHGGVCTALDAGRDREEGGFYLWTPRQLVTLLGESDGARAAALLQVTGPGTVDRGTSVLRLERPVEQLDPSESAFLRDLLPRLRDARAQRRGPGRDDKVVTSLNALMVRGWAVAGRLLAEPSFVAAAVRTATFLEARLVVDGRLQRSWKDGGARLPAYADDHAALSLALIDLYEATGDLHWLRRSMHWMDMLIELFWDADDGGLFYTGSDAERLLVRSKQPIARNEPGAHGLAALALARLAVFTGSAEYGARADQILARFQPLLDGQAQALATAAIAAAWRTTPAQELAILGEPGADPTTALHAVLREWHLPLLAVAPVAAGQSEQVAELIPWLAQRGVRPGRAKAYLCQGHACQLPATTPAALAAQLEALAPPVPS